jgi:ATP-dependent Lon protease
VRKTAQRLSKTPNDVDEKGLFAYGVTARIVGVQGRRQGDLALVVEGVRRFRAERFTQFKPYIECEATPLGEESECSTHHERIVLIVTVIDASDHDAHAQFYQLKELSRQLLTLVRLSSLLPRATPAFSPIMARRLELFITKKDFQEAGVLCDFMVAATDSTFEEKLQVLATLDIRRRMEKAIEILQRQMTNMGGNVKMTTFTENLPSQSVDISRLPNQSRDSFIKQALSGMRGGSGPPGLGGGPGGGSGADEEANELEELKQRLDDAKLTPEAQKVAEKELKRLRKMNPAGAEYGVCRTYLETLAEIPWSASTEDRLGSETLTRARKQLDNDHYGLEKIKKRLLEYLAVLKLKQTVNANLEAEIRQASETAEKKATAAQNDATQAESSREAEKQLQLLKSKQMIDKSPILLLVGPPGTGKTSLAKSVATALGRKFHRISLGGVRDEAEIRGHRRTYVAAMPGLIVNGLKKVAVNNPVFLLDEIDKVGGANFHGDPSAAMLEVLDPEQNHTFVDHYVNIPLDLSKVLFIATANSLDTIPPPLLDRMETIGLSGYTTIEKRHIASRHLVPKQIATNGLATENVQLPDDTLDTIITSYTREAGVRSLEREIGAVCRAKAVEYSDHHDASASASSSSSYNPTITLPDLETILGPPRFDDELADKQSVPGVVTGLVAYAGGGYGSILFIEVADVPSSHSGRIHLTGKLGDVLKESVEVALSWVRSHAPALGLLPPASPTSDPASNDLLAGRALHVHCPAGAVPKDGPSAGLAHSIALVSLFAGRAVRPDLALTGELSLRGRVLPVGGIKEKLIGAVRAGVRTVVMPKGNSKDLADLPKETRDALEIVLVENVWEGLRAVWPEVRWEEGWIESRL